jgi:hypothetical protein
MEEMIPVPRASGCIVCLPETLTSVVASASLIFCEQTSTIEVSGAPELKARAKDRWNPLEATPREVNALVATESSVIVNTKKSLRVAMVMGSADRADNECKLNVICT